MSGAGLIELLAARLARRAPREAAPELRQVLQSRLMRPEDIGDATRRDLSTWGPRGVAGDEILDRPIQVTPTSVDDLLASNPQFLEDPERAAEFAARSTPLPPVMMRGGKLIDGRHRLEAARIRGNDTIDAVDLDQFERPSAPSLRNALSEVNAARIGPDAGGGQGGSNATGYLSPREIAARDVLRRSPDISNEELSAALGMDDPLAAGIIRARVEKKTGMQAASAERVRLIDMVRNQNARLQRGQTAEVSRMSWDENTPMTMYQFPGEALTNVRITQRPDGVREVVFSARGLKQGAASRADIEGVFGDALSAMERDAITNPGGRYFFEGESPAITRLHALLLRNANMPDGVSARSVGDGIEVTFGRTQPDGGSGQAASATARVQPVDEALVARAVEHFGLTNDPREAGYVLPDGKMLDLSGRHEMLGGDYVRQGQRNVATGQDYQAGVRHTDHRDVPSDWITQRNDWGGASDSSRDMLDFQTQASAVRLMPNSGVSVTVRPTRRQIEAIARMWNKEFRGEPLLIDIDRIGGGNPISTTIERPNVENITRFFDEHFEVTGAGNGSRSTAPNAGSDRNALQRALRERMERE